MELSRTHIFAIVVLCQLVGYGAAEINVLSFGDFMEFHIGFHKACERIQGGQNATWEIISSFTQCTRSLEAPEDKDIYDVHQTVCKNRPKYLQCWDTMKAEALKKCGADKAPLLPSVYRATAAAVCGSDSGASNLGELKKAEAEMRPGDERQCPEETGRHWIELCQELLPLMHASDLCARHGAIDTCLKRMTCQNLKVARLTTQLYTNGRSHLQCN